MATHNQKARRPSGWDNPFGKPSPRGSEGLPSAGGGAGAEEEYEVTDEQDAFEIEIDPEKAVPNFVAAYPYDAKEVDELTLRKGDLIYVTEQGEDGWYIGANLTTSQAGTFPGNFVVVLQSEPDGDEELARRLQEEEERAAAASAKGGETHGRATAALTADEMLARKLQEEEDMRLARQAQSQAVAGQASSGRRVGRGSQDMATSLRASTISRGALTEFDRYTRDFETFSVGFLGSVSVNSLRSDERVQLAIREVLRLRKERRIKKPTPYELQVSPAGIRLVEQEIIQKKSIRRRSSVQSAKPGGSLQHFPLQRISQCAFDPSMHTHFGFVIRQHNDEHICHVFQYEQSASQIANAFRRAWNEVQERQRRSQR